jgi:hypothetical protein
LPTGPSRPRRASARSFADFVNQLYTAEIPKDFKEQDEWGNRPREIFCDALVDKAEPIESKAVFGYDLCLKAATKESWFNEWSTMCEVELNQLKPSEYPLAAEAKPEPGYVSTPITPAAVVSELPDDVQVTHETVGARNDHAWTTWNVVTQDRFCCFCPGFASRRLRISKSARRRLLRCPTRKRRGLRAAETRSMPAGVEQRPADIPMTKKKSGRQVTEDQKADFEKAAADYQNAKKNGRSRPRIAARLASQPSSAGGQGSRPARGAQQRGDHLPRVRPQGRGGQYLEFHGQRGEALRAGAGKPGLSGLAERQQSQCRILFNKSVQADPLVGSIFARINLAQIMREQARTAATATKEVAQRPGRAPPAHGVWPWTATTCRPTPG